MRLVLHRPEAFVSSCRTSLSSRVTCVAVEPISTSPDRGIHGYAARACMQLQRNFSQVAKCLCGLEAPESNHGTECPSFVSLRKQELSVLYRFILIEQRFRREQSQ